MPDQLVTFPSLARFRPMLIVVALAAVVVAGGIWYRVRQAGPAPATDQNQSLLPGNTAIGSPQVFPTRPAEPILCLPGVGICPNKTLCPKSGLCCEEGSPGCQAPANYQALTAAFCLNPGQPDCPGKAACPATGVCFVNAKSYPACVPGATCADGATCPKSGYCIPKKPTSVPCLPGKGICPDASQCPQTGICP